jgi:hypothetical protein
MILLSEAIRLHEHDQNPDGLRIVTIDEGNWKADF